RPTEPNRALAKPAGSVDHHQRPRKDVATMHPTQDSVSVAPTRPTIADTLRRAALYLIRHGWTQDNHYSNAMTPLILRTTTIFPAADVLGALVLAATGRTLLPAEVAT